MKKRSALFALGLFIVLSAASYARISYGEEAIATTKDAIPQDLTTTDPFNDRMAILVGSNGRFNIGAFPNAATGGSSDNSWNLTYRWPSSPNTSYATFRIDGADNVYGAAGTVMQVPSDIDQRTNKSTWKVGDVEITQTLQIVFNNQTNEEDVAKISYDIKNTGSVSHEVGGRLMLDTDLNYNDGAPFRVPGDGIITTEKEYIGAAVPDTFAVYYNVTDNQHVAAATLKSGGATPPDRLVLAYWGSIYDSAYDYSITPGRSLTSDSAYAVYWNPAAIAPGETRSYTTFYGLAQLHADLTPPLALGVTAPATLSVINDDYSPNPFTVTATVFNNGSATAENVELTLNLPEGLSLASGTPMRYIGNLAVGQDRQISWTVNAARQNGERTLAYSVDATASNAPAKNMPGQIVLPSVSPFVSLADVSIYHNFTGTSITTPMIADPVNSVFGNYLHSVRDIDISDRGLPLGFVRTYNSHSQENGSLGNRWTQTYDMRLDEYSNGVAFVNSDGRWDFFELQGDGSYKPTLDVVSTLQRNGDGTFSLITADETVYHFDAGGRLSSVTDANGNTLSLAYDENGNLSEAIAPTGRKLVFATDAEGRIISITDPAGRVYVYAYDAQGNLVSATNPAGGEMRYAYDANHYLVSITDANGHIVAQNEYDAEGRVSKQTDGRGNAGTFQYDTVSRLTTYTSSQGGVWEYHYDENFRVTRQVDAAGEESLSSFDANNRLVSQTDRNGHATSYEYDTKGNPIRVTDALGNDRIFSYDAKDNLVSSEDESGNVTSYAYDAQGNLITVIKALGAETKFAYDAYGQLISATDALGGVTAFAYDAEGNLINATDAAGGETGLEYDASGSLIGRTDPDGRRISMEYDVLGQLTKITDALGNSSIYRYDAMGNVVEAADAADATTKYAYDENNNLISVTDAMGGVTRYGYDKLNNLTTATNAAGNTVRYENNALSQVTRTMDPLGNGNAYGYDGAGNVIAVTTAEGKTITYGYDPLNRLVRKTFSDGTFAQFAYDAAGNLTGAQNQNVTYAYTYDALGLVTSFADSRFGTATYAYDVLGRRTQTTDGNDVLRYEYDGLSQLKTIYDTADKAYAFAYDAAGQRTALTLPNGISTHYAYDAAGQVKSLLATTRYGNDIFSEDYAYDTRGNRAAKETNWLQTTYAYDPLSRLTESSTELKTSYPEYASWSDSQSLGGGYGYESYTYSATGSGYALGYQEENYRYDSVGNRVAGPQDKSYVYDQADELLSVSGAYRPSAAFTYDKNGNVIKRTGELEWRYTYDDENRLVKAEQKSGYVTVNKIEYKYDPFGQRIQKRSYPAAGSLLGTVPFLYPYGSNGKIEQYRYDGEDIVAIYDGSKKLQMSFVHGPGVDEPLSVTYHEEPYLFLGAATAKTQYYTADALGSIVRLTDGYGNIAAAYSYDSFGNFRDSAAGYYSYDSLYDPDAGKEQPYFYTGREYDEETGLYYYRARYYNPSIGRFISKDPVAGVMVSPQTLNRYAYVTSNPVRYVDPFGLWVVDVIGGTIVGGEIGIKAFIKVGSEGVYFQGGPKAGLEIGLPGTFSSSNPKEGWSTDVSVGIGATRTLELQDGDIDTGWKFGPNAGVSAGEIYTIKLFSWPSLSTNKSISK